MPMDQVAELARQAANDDGVLRALQYDPTRIRKPLNLSEPQLRALISAGSFSTVRPVMTTSVAGHSLANQIAAMDVESLFPPEGQGQFPTPGELPPSPIASPVAGVPPRPTPPSPTGEAPQASAPTAAAPHISGAPVAHSAPQSNKTPQAPTAAPGHTPASPVASTGTQQTGTGRPSDGGQTASSGSGDDLGQQTGSASDQTPGSGQQMGSASGQDAGQTFQAYPAPFIGVPASSCCCGACPTAMIAIVAQLSTTAQAGITAITAIAGLG
jgi:hypothetical protein